MRRPRPEFRTPAALGQAREVGEGGTRGSGECPLSISWEEVAESATGQARDILPYGAGPSARSLARA